MYESFYKLHTKPFRLSPDPNFFYPSSGHKRALSYLLYGLNQGEGFVVITGAPGTGKTTLAHKLLSQIDTTNILVAHLSSTQVEAEDLLRLVATSFKLRSENVSKAGLIKDIESFLMARARERKRCLLVVDEAQNLPERSIEELRMLSNFQASHHALLQIFLLGQEQFRTMLDKPALEQLNQRVIANFHLNPLDATETQHYIEARLKQSGWTDDPHIADDAYSIIYTYTGGLPRRINMFADRLLLFGYMEGLHVITRDSVASVIEELKVDVTNRANSKVVFAQVDRAPLKSPEPVTPNASAANASTVLGRAEASPAPKPTKSVDPLPTLPTASVLAMTPSRESNAQPAPAPPPPQWAPNGSPKTPFTKTNNEIKGTPLPPAGRGSADVLPPTPQVISTPLGTTPLPPRPRWPAVLGAIAVLFIIGYWFFPYFESADVPTSQAEPSEKQQTAAASKSISGPQIDDPSERVLTENVIAPSNEAGGMSGGLDRRPSDTLPLTIPEYRDPSVATAEAAESRIPAAPSAPEHQTPSPDKERLQKNTSPIEVSIPARLTESKKIAQKTPPARVVSPPKLHDRPSASTVIPRDISTETSPDTRAPLAVSTGPEVSPTGVPPATAVAVNSEPAVAAPPVVEPLAQLELAQVLLKFARTYEEGNLDQFIQLFAENVRTEDQTSLEGVRNDYRDLFQKTVSRQILLGNVRWDITGRVAQGVGPFEVRIRGRGDDRPRSFKGTITFHVEKKENDVLITALFHTGQP